MPELWVETENMVRKVLIESNIPYIEVEDEAAFYGPKIDVQIYSAIGREFTLATNQVDFGQPARFGLSFANKNNVQETPLVIHRAPLGTHERFIGFLIEHYAGNFPVWLAPDQVSVLPLGEKNVSFAKTVYEMLRNNDIRTLFDDRNEKIGKKIRDAELRKVPYMLIIGDKEEQNNQVAVRVHGEGDKGVFSVNEFFNIFNQEKAKPFSN
jgi:threonyl-tRNA synthetase